MFVIFAFFHIFSTFFQLFSNYFQLFSPIWTYLDLHESFASYSILMLVVFQTTNNLPRDSRDIKVDLVCSLNGPYMSPKMDLINFEPISGCIYYYYVVCYVVAHLTILENFLGHCGTLPGLKGPSWTFMDPQMDP